MRLLERKNDDEFTLTKDIIDNIPDYAILSHTWGADTEEVTFRDLTDGTGKDKTGYSKIRFCGEQARHDGYQYFWVDTCCIDKSNNTELAEAINSMFRWYHHAAKCYVYLSDVPRDAPDTDEAFCQLPWELAFRKSRWFTRGWTLQELIAPKSVEFFSKYWEQLGNKASLGTIIHEITGIPDTALQGVPLSDFSVAERMSWAERRETTRKEDQVYSLLGIFDVYMPLIYGEGKEHALERLREIINKHSKALSGKSGLDSDLLHHLPYTIEAPFNSYAKQDSSTCLPNTRVGLLEEIYNWVDSEDERCIFWLNGLAGTGKSTIARTIARRYFEQKRLGASFFFSRGGGDVGHAGKFFTSIAVQLAYNAPSLRQHISEAVEEQIDIANHSLRDQWCQLVIRPLLRLDKRLSPSSYLLIVDALDECDNKDHIRTILQLLGEARSLTTVRLRVFLTSRPEVPIRHGIRAIPQAEHQDFVLHNIQSMIVNHDISLFLEYHLGIIGQEWTLGANWPGEEVLRQLILNTCGLFIWAATACRFIREGKRFARKRLDTILKGSSSSAITAPEKHLNEIYLIILKNSISSEYSDEEKEEACNILKHTLGSLVVLLSPLSTFSLSRLLCLPKEDVDATFNDLYAILDIPEDPTRQLRLHHPSFRDFLLNKDRCGDFWVDEKKAHQILAAGCIRLMSQTLKQDICGVDAPGMLVADIESSRVKQNLSLEIQYACRYWIKHLQKSGAQLSDNDHVHHFLQEHLLHWLEALGWMTKVPEGVQAIATLESYVPSSDCPDLWGFIHDAKRFALYNRSVIEQAPLQTYSSALIFAPTTSIIREKFKTCIPKWIRTLPRVEKKWHALQQTLEGHLDMVFAVAFSADGKQLASASEDKTIKLWDAGSGLAIRTIESHEGSVKAVTFSPNGKLLASASRDTIIKLWNASSGEELLRLQGHSSYVNTIVFSPDGKLLASGSSDATVRLWDASSGGVLQMLEGHSSFVHTIAFSPDGKLLASASTYQVCLWDTCSWALVQMLDDENGIGGVAFSPDGKRLACGYDDQMVKIWDARSGELLKILEGHEDCVVALAFSPDGTLLASGSGDHSIKLWDGSSGALLRTLESHQHWVEGLAFSPDSKKLASASHDKTVKLWDANLGEAGQALRLFERWIHAMVFSPGGTLLACGSHDGTVELWDVSSTEFLQTMGSHESSVTAVAFSTDGRLLASASYDKTVKLWDVGSRAVLQTLTGHAGFVRAVAFSTNGKLLASTSDDRTIKLWDISLGIVIWTFNGHEDFVMAVSFAPDNKLLASASKDETVKIWNAHSGVLLQTLKGHTGAVTAVVFSPDGKVVVSASEDNKVKMWDTGTGAVLQTHKANADIRTLSIVDNGTSLQTDRGLLPISSFFSHGTAVTSPTIPPSVFVVDQWVCRGANRILWLPPEYRASSVAVHGSIVGLGYTPRRVSIIKFSF